MFIRLQAMGSEQLGGVNAEFARQLLYHIDGGGILATLKTADICPVDAGTVRKFFLRQSACRTVPLQILCQDLAQRHGAQWSPLQSI
jgi:hypothetical protein